MSRRTTASELADALELLPDAVLVINSSDNVRISNQHAASLFGVAPSALDQCPARRLGLNGLRDRVQNADQHVSAELQIRLADGTAVHAEVTATSCDVEGDICAIVAVRLPRASQSSSQNRALESPEIDTITTLLGSIGESALIVGRNGDIERANRPALDLLDVDPGDLGKLKIGEVFVSGSGNVICDLLEKGNPVADRQATILSRSGARLEVLVNGVTLSSGNASAIHFKDITTSYRTEVLEQGQAAILEMVARHRPANEIALELATILERIIPDACATVSFLRTPRESDTLLQPVVTPRAREVLLNISEWQHAREPWRPELQAIETRSPVRVAVDELTDDDARFRSSLVSPGVAQFWVYPVLGYGNEVVALVEIFRLHSGTDEVAHQLARATATLGQLAFQRIQFGEEFAEQAFNDLLTGLPNRIVLIDRLQSALERASQSDHSVAVLLLDLDQFRLVNDSLGHTAGDELLQAVAQRLQGSLRTHDLVARLSADEFAIMLDRIQSEQDAISVVLRMQRAFAIPFNVQQVELYPSFSVGIALGSGLDIDAQTLLQYADISVHRAKEKGQGQFALFSPARDLSDVPTLELQSRLYRALAADALKLHYQPVVSLRNNEIVGYEGLIRWEDSEFGTVAPEEFLPLAQHSGIMSEITAWVLDRSVSQLIEWQETVDENLLVCINVTPAELRERLIIEQVAAVVSRYEIEPGVLVVEVTEQALVDLDDEPWHVLEQLRKLGVRIALDDFGTGYSSLSYLERLPVDWIKIDRAFIQAARGGASRAPVASAMVDLARTLGIATVAEGIETEEDERVAKRLGCDLSQGYFYGRPVTGPEILTGYPRDQEPS